MDNRSKQLGSVKTFFIVGFILTCVLIGSAVYLKNHGESVRKPSVTPTSQNQTKPAKEDTGKTTENTHNSTSSTGSTDSTNNQTTNSTATNAEDLPTTGPESTVAEMVAVFVLTVGATSYFRSRAKKTNVSL